MLFDKPTILYGCDESQKAYDDRPEPGYMKFSTIHSTEGFINATEPRIIVAFRGTVEIEDWKHNLDANMVGWTVYGKSVGVHSGFLSKWKSARQIVFDILAPYVKKIVSGERSVMVIGHSLGGALASLCGVELSQSFKVSILTYAAPRVGDAAYRDMAGKLVDNNLRVQVRGDAVPQVPDRELTPWWGLYRHDGRILEIGEGLPKAKGARNWMDEQWHKVQRYCGNIVSGGLKLDQLKAQVGKHGLSVYRKDIEALPDAWY